MDVRSVQNNGREIIWLHFSFNETRSKFMKETEQGQVVIFQGSGNCMSCFAYIVDTFVSFIQLVIFQGSGNCRLVSYLVVSNF